MKRKVPESLKFKDYLIAAVELEGIEPSSKRGNHKTFYMLIFA